MILLYGLYFKIDCRLVNIKKVQAHFRPYKLSETDTCATLRRVNMHSHGQHAASRAPIPLPVSLEWMPICGHQGPSGIILHVCRVVTYSGWPPLKKRRKNTSVRLCLSNFQVKLYHTASFQMHRLQSSTMTHHHIFKFMYSTNCLREYGWPFNVHV